MRQQVATWLLEVCEEGEGLAPGVFPQAIHIFDRFLSKQDVKATELQLLAATSLFLASKGLLTSLLMTESCVRGWLYDREVPIRFS